MKLTITQLTKMLEKGQLEHVESEYDGLYLHGKYRITHKGFETLSQKMLNLITHNENESQNKSTQH